MKLVVAEWIGSRHTGTIYIVTHKELTSGCTNTRDSLAGEPGPLGHVGRGSVVSRASLLAEDGKFSPPPQKKTDL